MVSSLDNRNAESTGRYWLMKTFEVLKDYQKDILLGERFWIDETYLSKKPSDTSKDRCGKKLRGFHMTRSASPLRQTGHTLRPFPDRMREAFGKEADHGHGEPYQQRFDDGG